MKKILIGNIPLHYYENIYTYPFVNKKKDKRKVITYINAEGILEEFCFFQNNVEEMLDFAFRIDYDYLSAQISTENGHELAIIKKGGIAKYLVREKIGYRMVRPGDMVALSERYLLNKDKIISLLDGNSISVSENAEDYCSDEIYKIIYLFLEKSIMMIDYEAGIREKIYFEKYNPNWELIGVGIDRCNRRKYLCSNCCRGGNGK